MNDRPKVKLGLSAATGEPVVRLGAVRSAAKSAHAPVSPVAVMEPVETPPPLPTTQRPPGTCTNCGAARAASARGCSFCGTGEKEGKGLREWRKLSATLRRHLSVFRTSKPIRFLVPVAVAVLGLVLLGFLKSRPVKVLAPEVTQLQLEEGESRMITISYEPYAPALEFRGGNPAVLDVSVFFLQEEPEPLLHVLVTGVSGGDAEWSVEFADGRSRVFRTRVDRAPAFRGTAQADLLRAASKIEEGDQLVREGERDPSFPHRAVECYREACRLLRGFPYGAAEDLYASADRKLQDAVKIRRELYERTEGDLAVHKMNGERRAIRETLKRLLVVVPEERSAEYQKNATLLNYVYAPKKKSKGREAEE